MTNGTESSPNNGKENNEDSTRSQGGIPPEPTSKDNGVKGEKGSTTNESDRCKYVHEEKSGRGINFTIMLATVVMAGTTIFQLCVLSRQTGIMSKQADLMGSQTVSMSRQTTLMEKQNTIISGQSAFMEQQTDIMRESAVVANRAYLSVKALIPLKNFRLMKAGEVVRCSAEIINTGNSPAYDWNNFTQTAVGLTDDIFPDRRSIIPEKSGASIGVNIPYPIGSSDRVLSQGLIDSLINKQARLYFRIIETYYDFAGNPHALAACGFFNNDLTAWEYTDSRHNYEY